MITHSDVKNYSCSTCNATFTTNSSMRKHQVTVHDGERNFACDACDMK